MTCVVHGNQARWAFEPSVGESSTAVFDASSVQFAPKTDSIGVAEEIAQSEALMGTRLDQSVHSRVVGETVAGQIVFEASYELLDFFLPYMTGDTSGPYTLQEATCRDFDFMRDDGATVWLFRNCFVSSSTIRVSGAGLVEISLDIVGKVGSLDGTYASAGLQTGAGYDPYASHEAVVTIGGTTRYAESWEFTINQGIELVARQSLSLNRVILGKAEVMFNANMEWDAANEAAVYGKGKDGISTELRLTDGTNLIIVDMEKLVIPKSPVPVSNAEVLWNFQGTVRGDGIAADMLVIALSQS